MYRSCVSLVVSSLRVKSSRSSPREKCRSTSCSSSTTQLLRAFLWACRWRIFSSIVPLRTRLEGETTMTLSISGLTSGLWRSRVQMRAMHCKVFPRPISSAMMQPYESEMRLPVTQSHRNFTP
ncbi:hypothetical protein EYF80_012303 [Liparis tanakae]|uniref:Uncharacterized protein n=1 Tax=Liparis tanakae TaxID=230148 RepID=A0A4Z2IHJ9_9TELE|nr:hypothetical protein EYF80_012303 [Liparis tanakae]